MIPAAVRRTADALRAIGVSGASLTDEQRRSFDEDGFFYAPELLTAEQCDAIGAEFDRLSAEAKPDDLVVTPEEGVTRLSDPFNKSVVFDFCLELPPVLEASAELLGEIKLHGANLRDPWRGRGAQRLHSDVVDRRPGDWRVVNALIFIDPLDEDNGPTRVIPGSHAWAALDVPADPLAPYAGQVLVTGQRGTAAVINAHIWHGGTANVSGRRRRMLHLSYTRRDWPQQFDQRAHLTAALWERLSPAQRFLLDVDNP
ncbi:MAG TPA: phytanoyl-CoA dioxygenase family protein [Acidimicrobiales bacterium]|nr:phytanoyl-CoA dioxygenase family protein [Acidimicrobiales bacterium]